MENFIRDESSEYNEGIMLDEYQGKISLVNAQEGQDGKIYKRWIHPSTKDRTPSEKAIPWKITLGEPRVALEKLKTLVAMIEAELGLPPDDEDNSIPF